MFTVLIAFDEVWRSVYCKLSPFYFLISHCQHVQVTLIPGDGIGTEITDSVKEIFEYINAPIEWDQYDVSGMASSGEALFKQAMDSLKRNRVGLKGASPSRLVYR